MRSVSDDINDLVQAKQRLESKVKIQKARIAELERDSKRLEHVKNMLQGKTKLKVQFNCDKWEVIEPIPCSTCSYALSEHDDFNAAIDAATEVEKP